jgi:hypothetical protein
MSTLPRKILFAASDVGYRMALYKKFIQSTLKDKLTAESLVISVVPKKHYETNYDYEYNFFGKNFLYRWTRAMLNFFRSLLRYDVFHFISGETLLTRKLRHLELMIYKIVGKKIIMHFVGVDIRSADYIQWKEKNIFQYLQGKDDFRKTERWQTKLISDAEKFADYILVSTPDLLELIPSAHYFPVLLDVEKFQSELAAFEATEKKSGEIIILHCPTNAAKNMKGTVHIDVVLEKIAAESTYNIKLIRPYKAKEGTAYTYTASRYELFKLYKEADIVIDQMVIGWYGLLSVEALAAGKEVICYVDKKLKSYLFPECPIHIADMNELEKTLILCIEKLAKGKSTDTIKQLEWVKKFHSIWENHSELLHAWNIKQ